jgi:hypothetical protein
MRCLYRQFYGTGHPLNSALAVSPAPNPSDGKTSLQRLVDGALKERQLNLMLVTTVGEKGARELSGSAQTSPSTRIFLAKTLKFNQPRWSSIPPSFDLGVSKRLPNDLWSKSVESTWRVMLPLIKPSLVFAGLWTGLASKFPKECF